MDGQAGAKVGLQNSVPQLSPLDVASHQLIGQRVVAPKGIAQEVHEIHSVPLRGDAGVLEMLTGVRTLLEDAAVRSQDHHAESVEHADVAGVIDRLDHGVWALDVNGDLGVRRDVDALELKQKSAHCHGAFDSGGAFPDGLPSIGFERPSRRGGEITGGRWSRAGRRAFVHRRSGQHVLVHGPRAIAHHQGQQDHEDCGDDSSDPSHETNRPECRRS